MDSTLDWKKWKGLRFPKTPLLFCCSVDTDPQAFKNWHVRSKAVPNNYKRLYGHLAAVHVNWRKRMKAFTYLSKPAEDPWAKFMSKPSCVGSLQWQHWGMQDVVFGVTSTVQNDLLQVVHHTDHPARSPWTCFVILGSQSHICIIDDANIDCVVEFALLSFSLQKPNNVAHKTTKPRPKQPQSCKSCRPRETARFNQIAIWLKVWCVTTCWMAAANCRRILFLFPTQCSIDTTLCSCFLCSQFVSQPLQTMFWNSWRSWWRSIGFWRTRWGSIGVWRTRWGSIGVWRTWIWLTWVACGICCFCREAKWKLFSKVFIHFHCHLPVLHEFLVGANYPQRIKIESLRTKGTGRGSIYLPLLDQVQKPHLASVLVWLSACPTTSFVKFLLPTMF